MTLEMILKDAINELIYKTGRDSYKKQTWLSKGIVGVGEKNEEFGLTYIYTIIYKIGKLQGPTV